MKINLDIEIELDEVMNQLAAMASPEVLVVAMLDAYGMADHQTILEAVQTRMRDNEDNEDNDDNQP